MKHIATTFRHIWRWLRARPWKITITILILLGIGYFVFNGNQTPEAELITAEKGTIRETVNITGIVKPVQEVDLAFEKSGKIVAVNYEVGDQVNSGAVIVSLDTQELQAQLLEAEANIESRLAKLSELQRGARPEEIQTKEAELNKANQDLDNLYQSVADVIADAFVKADDAVRKQLNPLFNNDEELNAQLTFAVSNTQLKNDAEQKRVNASITLNSWNSSLGTISTFSTTEDLDAALTTAQESLLEIRDLLSTIMQTVTANVALSSDTNDTYKAAITTGRNNVNTSLSNVNSQIQSLASQKFVVKRIENELALTLAGASAEELQAQEAVVKQARASSQAIRAQIEKLILRAPFAGTITLLEADRGEIVSPNTTIVGLISENEMEIEANVPEVDIGAIANDSPVLITLDAFPGEVLNGRVAMIDPAETIIDGVTNFKIKVTFDNLTSKELLKSGLTANLDIIAREKNDVLALPQYALLEKDDGVYVRLLDPATEEFEEVAVGTGLRGEDGLVEITSGLVEGQQVANIGIRTE